MGKCITMSMVTQRSVECHARWSFLFTGTAFSEIALSTRRACVLPMQSRRYFKPSIVFFIDTKIIVCQQVFASLPRKWSIYYLVVYLPLA